MIDLLQYSRFSPLALWLLIPLAVVVLILALQGRLYLLFVLAVAVGVTPRVWEVGGATLDPTDVALFGLLLTALFRTKFDAKALWRRVPYRKLWLALMVISAVAFLSAPVNRILFVDTSVDIEGEWLPLHTMFHLYRKAWREYLFYPLTAALVSDKEKVRKLLLGVLIATNISALLSIPVGYQGWRTGGMLTYNTVGSAYLLSWLCLLGGLMLMTSRRAQVLILANLALLVRAVLFSGSRGAFITIIVASVFFSLGLSRFAATRRLLYRWSWAAVLLLGSLVVLKPDLLERPNISRVGTITNIYEQSTLQWRMTERWPHYWKLSQKRPWLGLGTSFDTSLGDMAGTAHNGYLAIAVERGYPVLVLILLFGVIGIVQGVLVHRRYPDLWSTLVGQIMAAFIVGLFIHNIVDETLAVPFVARLYWVAIALVGLVVGGDREVEERSMNVRIQTS